MTNIDRRSIDLYLKKIALGFVVFLLSQGVLGIVAAVQIVERVKQNKQDVVEIKSTLSAGTHAIIRMEEKLRTVMDDVSDIKANDKETQKLIRSILREVKK